jgi:transposase
MGDSINNGHIRRMDNKIVRTTLVQTALRAVKHNEYLRNFYLKLKNKKENGEAIIVVARKMLEIITRH